MKKLFVQAWLTVLCFLLLGDVHAWEVPTYLRINSGARMWFTQIQGDLIQKNHLKLDLGDNVGIKPNKLAWEFFTNFRFHNIHVLRFRAEPLTTYESRDNSYLQVRNFRLGYDLDFYMSPQMLFGANLDLSFTNYDSRVRNVTIGDATFDYSTSQNRTNPLLGLHATYYPILEEISIRPNFSTRVNWWNYESLETWDIDMSAAVDVPINCLWTWTVAGGYRIWHTKTKREKDTLDLNRNGFFLETSLLF